MTVYQVDLGSESLIAFGPLLPHQDQQSRSPDDFMFVHMEGVEGQRFDV